MTRVSSDHYAAGEQGLGYIYQPRFALLKLLQWPKDTSVFIEKDDDLNFVNSDDVKTLASLKHKGDGDTLTDLSTDFWKSVRIWLDHYNRDGKTEANFRFFLFTTGTISNSSFLQHFLVEPPAKDNNSVSITQLANTALARSKSKLITAIADEFNKLTHEKKDEFFQRLKSNVCRSTSLHACSLR
ncbi:hypothetical protein AAGQ96_17700 [Pantoea sp. MBD-2R]|uniref:hypothetical protein n=1 Tax=Pantoea sp. MBD-2R TaxID=3141540 RepID=UPI003183FC96